MPASVSASRPLAFWAIWEYYYQATEPDRKKWYLPELIEDFLFLNDKATYVSVTSEFLYLFVL